MGRELNFDLKIIYPCTQHHAALRLEAGLSISKQQALIKNSWGFFVFVFNFLYKGFYSVVIVRNKLG